MVPKQDVNAEESSGSMFREVGVIGQCYEQMKGLAMHSLEIVKDLHMKRFINGMGLPRI